MTALPPIRFPENISPEQEAAVRASPHFKAYLRKATLSFDFRAGKVEHVSWFGGNRPGFILFKCDALTPDGHTFPGNITFIRGGSAAVLLILETPDGCEWCPVVHQPRIAAGDADFPEIVAGMIDDGDFRSTILNEIEEELGVRLELRSEDLILLDTVYLSPGSSDEEIALFSAKIRVGQEVIEGLRNRIAGLEAAGERIRVDVCLLHEVPSRTRKDAKSKLAYYSYMANLGLIARPPGG